MAEARSRTLLWVLIGGGAFFLFVLAVFALVYLTLHAGGSDAGISGFGDKIGVVDLEGVILSPQPVVGQLKKFADDSSIKAIIIHVNPGRRGGCVGGDLSRGQAHSQREEKENCRLD
jgi:protease-4